MKTKRIFSNTALRSLTAAALLFGSMAMLRAEDATKISTDEAMAAVVTKVAPDYPALAKQLRLSGTVEVQATMNEEGDVTDVNAISGNPVLAKAATDAVKKWKFKPFKSKVTTTILVGFHGA